MRIIITHVFMLEYLTFTLLKFSLPNSTVRLAFRTVLLQIELLFVLHTEVHNVTLYIKIVMKISTSIIFRSACFITIAVMYVFLGPVILNKIIIIVIFTRDTFTFHINAFWKHFMPLNVV